MRQYEIALTFIPGIGDITGKKLVAYCGGPDRIFTSGRQELYRIKALGRVVVDKLLSGRDAALRRAEKELAFIERYKIGTRFFLDKQYPWRLANCPDGPMMIYYKGTADLNAERIVGVVGTRKATGYGREVCSGLIRGLTETGAVVVSGLAFGIDSCAHRNALALTVPTIGVLGHGLDRIYPFQHKSLAEKMIRNGGLLTDFPSGTEPDRENFPKRNRIIAGLCDALIVIEAAEKGGALITADIANSYNRDVFAVPGRITDEYSRGCNRYIRLNKAALAETAEDIKYLMGWDIYRPKSSCHPQLPFASLTEEEERIMTLLRQHHEAGIDILISETGISSSKMARLLLNLEFNGFIRSMPGKRYQPA